MRQFTIMKGDITKIEGYEAIVNAANPTLLGGGGVDGAIHKAAGPKLLKECKKLHGCERGQAIITNAYKLPCDYVIHTAGPIWSSGKEGEAEVLASCYRECLNLAKSKGIKSIAFPSISTGVYHFPIKEAAEIAIGTLLEFVRNNEEYFEHVAWVLFDDETYKIYSEVSDRMMNEEYSMD